MLLGSTRLSVLGGASVRTLTAVPFASLASSICSTSDKVTCLGEPSVITPCRCWVHYANSFVFKNS